MNYQISNSSLISGTPNGNEPSSIIIKVSGTATRNLAFKWRLMAYFGYGKSIDEQITLTEFDFFEKILPEMEGTGFNIPKLYFKGNFILSIIHLV